MISWMRRVLPPTWTIWLFIFLYALAWTPQLLMLMLGLPSDSALAKPRFVFLLLASGLYGIHRVFAFHPILRPEYYKWLKTTPWSRRQPLPVGPVHLISQDLVVILIIHVLGMENPHIEPAYIPLVFMTLYLVSLSSVLAISKIYRHAYGLAFGFGLMGYLFHNYPAMLAVAIVLYGIGYWGLRCSLAAYPWESDTDQKGVTDFDLFLSNRSAEEIRTLKDRRRVGWPYEPLKLHRPEPIISLEHGILISLLAGWFAYVICSHAKPMDKKIVATSLLVIIVYFGVLVRILVYHINCSWPINIWGRLFTFRLIIPGYDKIFVAPLITIIMNILLSYILPLLSIPIEIRTAIILSLALMILLNVGPTLGSWWLTGHHRMSPPSQLGQNQFLIRI
ncbi:MAG: hypothetical protein JSV03_12625 [Planctomycetota bacterium]|nr:MAG: hypothetical protein JSV03_12625 [Planctomycetota bacterium]